MTLSQKTLLIVNIIGGILVLGSYVFGLVSNPGRGMELWGNLPEAIRPVYTASMFAAAAGYFFFLYHLVFRANANTFKLPFGLPFYTVHIVFMMILVPSAIWMSLTFAYIDAPSVWMWALVRVTLFTVGVGSALLVAILMSLKATSPGQFWWPSVAGATVFTFHTLVLDATVWPIYFH